MSLVEYQLPSTQQHPSQADANVRERQRVFLMINSFETGGSERQFVSLAKSLNAEQFALDLGCIQNKGPLRAEFDEVPRFRLGGSVYGWKSWHSRWQLARRLRKQRIQIAHAFDFYTNLTLTPAAKWAGVPIVIGSQRQLGDLLSRAQARAQLAAFRWCSVVVCNSSAAAQRLVRAGLPSSKIRIIGNALGPEAFAESLPLFPRCTGILRVGMIARMNAIYKNHLGFLEAAAKLHAKFPETEFLLAGDGPLRQELEARAGLLGIGDCVRFLGDRRDITAVLASLDVTIVPSDSESLSNVVLESMAAGVPVIATRVGGNPELVSDDRGILVPAGDVDALAVATEQLLRNPARRTEFSVNARRFAQDNFSVASITAQYQELYEDLLSRARRSVSAKGGGYISSDKMRVAIVAPSLRYVGGQSVQADLMLRHWQDDPAVEASFIPVDPEFPFGLRWAMRVPGLRTVVRAPFYFAGLWRGLRNVNVAHVFSASYSSFLVAVLPAWLIARIRGKKVLINYHSGEARGHLRSSRIARSVLKRADLIVTPSAYLVEVFREFGLRAQPVANVVDVSQFSYRNRKLLRPHLICTRGFHSYYCIDVVVSAFAKVKTAFPDAQLDLVGGGPLENDIRQQVADLKLAGVNFRGVSSRNEIGKYYDMAEIFINASRLDNMPVSVLEAFASGTPVISTSPEGMQFLVEHGRTGLLSEPGDPDALADNVLQVLRHGELAAHLSSNGFEEMQRYRWDIVRENWLNVYRCLVADAVEIATKSVASS